ncbi:MAG: Flp pilus assembly TadE-like protein [Hyphomicrobiales bacterium]|nr:Flp pilus assembly TadE-like protein [Hyphomicrobiales bacterium]
MTLYRKLLSTAERFNRDRTGVVAVIFALLLLPLIGLVGLATDYGMARASQGRLQATADAAALAGARAARTVLSETGGTQAEAIDAANSHANSYMMKVTSEGRGITIDSSVASFQVKSGEIIGTLKFTARSKANFAPLFGVPSLQIGGTAEARADLDGTSVATRQKLVILVTDGVSDESPAGSMSERNYLRPMRSAAMQSWKCDALKQKNVRVVVVETFYIPIVTGNGSGFYNYLVKPWEGSISTALKGCASPGVDNYFQASSAADIEAAMAKVFASVVNPLRLTN